MAKSTTCRAQVNSKIGELSTHLEWIEEGKTDATREKRMETAIECMAEGKIRNWKYVRK